MEHGKLKRIIISLTMMDETRPSDGTCLSCGCIDPSNMFCSKSGSEWAFPFYSTVRLFLQH